jgi:hypothetical protein
MERVLWITDDPLRCQVCGVRIGVYEPLIVRVDGVVRRTAVAANSELSADVGEHYHLDCYSSQLSDYAFVDPYDSAELRHAAPGLGTPVADGRDD